MIKILEKIKGVSITKRKLTLLLACTVAMSLTVCGGGKTETLTIAAPATTAATEVSREETKEAAADTTAAKAADGDMDALIEAAEAEGELTVHGSYEEKYLSTTCKNFESLYKIETRYQRLSTLEIYTKISEEADKPSTDVWFSETTDLYDEAVTDGLLIEYDAINAKSLINDSYKDPISCWCGVYKGVLGSMVNTKELNRLGLEAPKIWDDLTKEEYKGLIILSNPDIAGTAKLLINTMVQMKGHDKAMEYSKKLDKSISQYTRSGSGSSKMIGPGECAIDIGFLHDGIYQILQGYDNIQLIVPEDGTSFEVDAAVVFNGCTHPNAAKLWVEYVLSLDCADHTKEDGSYRSLVLSNATRPEEAAEFGLDMNNIIDCDLEDAEQDSARYAENFLETLGNSAGSADSSRSLTE